MGKRCGERPRVHFRSQVVCLCVPVMAVRKVLAGVIKTISGDSHNPLCLFFLVLQFTERQRAKDSQEEETSSLWFWSLKAAATTDGSTGVSCDH